jgi:hypothetical protein
MTKQLSRQVGISLENLIRACPVHRTHMSSSSPVVRLCLFRWTGSATCVTSRWTLVPGVRHVVGNKIVGHMNIPNQKERSSSYKSWVGCLKVVVLHYKSRIFMWSSLACELSVSSEFTVQTKTCL